MNANTNSVGRIAAHPAASAVVPQFFALKPRLFIDGERAGARSGKTVAVFAPATGKQIGLVADAGREHGRVAVDVHTETKSVCIMI